MHCRRGHKTCKPLQKPYVGGPHGADNIDKEDGDEEERGSVKGDKVKETASIAASVIANNGGDDEVMEIERPAAFAGATHSSWIHTWVKVINLKVPTVIPAKCSGEPLESEHRLPPPGHDFVEGSSCVQIATSMVSASFCIAILY